MNTLYVLASISGMGKSTYAKTLGCTIISSDAIREELLGDAADQSINGALFKEIIPERLEAALKLGDTCLDATNYDRKSRKMPIWIAREQGCRVECHYFKPNVEKAWAQNNMRDRVVPLFVIENQARKWVEPTMLEGFDEVKEIVI